MGKAPRMHHLSHLVWWERTEESEENQRSKARPGERHARMDTSPNTRQFDGQTVQVSHLEKVYWPQTGFTKGDLLDYYRQMAPILLPHLKDRPVTLRVYPQGVAKTSYYLRD